jgi:predicted GIY-YIG superfamily endonuclease
MWYVYIIRSIDFPEQEYVGATSDLKRRLPEQVRTHRQVQALAIGLVLRLSGQA